MVNNAGYKDKKTVPIQSKLLLTVDEAAEYSNIGTKKLRELIRDPTCGFVLHVASKHLIKREKFEEYISEKIFL